MNLSGRWSFWAAIALAFVFGALAGVVLEYVIGVGSGTGAIAAVGGALVIVASLVTVIVQEGFTRGRERKHDLREHADLLNAQVYTPIQAMGTTIVGQQLTLADPSMSLMHDGMPDWGYRDRATNSLVPVSELGNWTLAKAHFQTDPVLAEAFHGVWNRLKDRVTRKNALDELYIKKIAKAIESVFGPGFPLGWGYTAPELPRWFNGQAVTQWLRAGVTSYVFTEQVAGNQHRIIGGGMIVLTSDRPFTVPVTDFARVVGICKGDSDLRAVWKEWTEEDARDQHELATFLRLAKHAGERIQATHTIPGQCELCRA